MGKTADIMKFSTAISIRNLVNDLNESFDQDYYKCAIVEGINPIRPGECGVHLYSATGTSCHLIDLAALASAIEHLSANICVRFAWYNTATKGDNFVRSVYIH